MRRERSDFIRDVSGNWLIPAGSPCAAKTVDRTDEGWYVLRPVLSRGSLVSPTRRPVQRTEG
jgi:hypothetical protein